METLTVRGFVFDLRLKHLQTIMCASTSSPTCPSPSHFFLILIYLKSKNLNKLSLYLMQLTVLCNMYYIFERIGIKLLSCEEDKICSSKALPRQKFKKIFQYCHFKSIISSLGGTLLEAPNNALKLDLVFSYYFPSFSTHVNYMRCGIIVLSRHKTEYIQFEVHPTSRKPDLVKFSTPGKKQTKTTTDHTGNQITSPFNHTPADYLFLSSLFFPAVFLCYYGPLYMQLYVTMALSVHVANCDKAHLIVKTVVWTLYLNKQPKKKLMMIGEIHRWIYFWVFEVFIVLHSSMAINLHSFLYLAYSYEEVCRLENPRNESTSWKYLVQVTHQTGKLNCRAIGQPLLTTFCCGKCARCLMVKAQGSRSSFKWANHLISSLLMMSLFLIFCVFHHHYHFYLKSGSWLLCHLFPHHFILIKPVIRESEIVCKNLSWYVNIIHRTSSNSRPVLCRKFSSWWRHSSRFFLLHVTTTLGALDGMKGRERARGEIKDQGISYQHTTKLKIEGDQERDRKKRVR
ncbi:hypothetical protein VP01_660g1 [Puccinia sorghi]|uniref:Uncharacterized protein n=1 Tax=Puccinia sorghi TaxID=27349 RepID=A0A0L6UF54_9BASI|nr:hypothetical protein VP01_660g1 [Puccinia sorghi]